MMLGRYLLKSKELRVSSVFVRKNLLQRVNLNPSLLAMQ